MASTQLGRPALMLVRRCQGTGAVAWVSLLEGWQDARPSCTYEAARPAAPDQARAPDALLCAGLFDLNAGCKRFGTGMPEVPPGLIAQGLSMVSMHRHGCTCVCMCSFSLMLWYRYKLCCKHFDSLRRR